MAASLVSPALVLRTKRVGERDRRVTLLTPGEGKITVMAKGVRLLTSRRASALQPGSILRCSWVKKGEFRTLTEVMLEKSVFTAHSSLERLRDITALLEVMYHLSLEEVEQAELYENAVALLEYVGSAPEYNRGWIRARLYALAQLQGVEIEDGQQLSVSEVIESVLGRKIRSFQFFQ